uniref:Uncharacterized protein n=1 Tax=Knipowitschia caucasica TaxID=637954 RepID=A0AAV2KCV3_KNICA
MPASRGEWGLSQLKRPDSNACVLCGNAPTALAFHPPRARVSPGPAQNNPPPNLGHYPAPAHTPCRPRENHSPASLHGVGGPAPGSKCLGFSFVAKQRRLFRRESGRFFRLLPHQTTQREVKNADWFGRSHTLVHHGGVTAERGDDSGPALPPV